METVWPSSLIPKAGFLAKCGRLIQGTAMWRSISYSSAFLEIAERIQIFHFDLGAEFFCAA